MVVRSSASTLSTLEIAAFGRNLAQLDQQFADFLHSDVVGP